MRTTNASAEGGAAQELQRSVERGVGAAGPTRTDDLTLTKRLLYQLSYSGIPPKEALGRRSILLPSRGSGLLPERLAAAYWRCARTRTITSMPSGTTPAGKGGSPETVMSAAAT